ncbi:hypothetical protein G6M89_13870 [Natronolimnobius sp. AArcel1]|uniref:hypothetical protein n=1 Tax=Natronolimnobius sp. AArcel1 TaxID=1679093 RepID=UPI0013EE3F33|nr:hypothetical protein [Natronolimnobius sp. AArcel1]NGM70080.1 hypothetical protein [Natronolimnobius sp. AArcel1]
MKTNQFVSARQHLLIVVLLLTLGLIGYYSTSSELQIAGGAVIVGFHYGFMFLYAIENRELTAGESLSDSAAFVLWAVSLVVTVSLFQTYVASTTFFNGVFAMGVGYLSGWLLHYR